MSSDLPDLPAPKTTVDNAEPGDAWLALRRHTAARIALGRTGASLPTRERLAFDVAHAQARDAVHAPLDAPALREALHALGCVAHTVTSRAADRAAYLARPDWGRRLSAASASAVDALRGEPPQDLAIMIADGLSATAVQRQVPPLMAELLPRLSRISIAPLIIATEARVALSDEVGERLGARIAINLIGERPGLSSADSLGVYITYLPRIGRTDAERNCISNVRPEGLPLPEAAAQIAALVHAALAAQQTGVSLRFEPGSATSALPTPSSG